MSVSETLQNVQFSKSIAGYAQKEVDALLAELLPFVKEAEERMVMQEAELAAWNKRVSEIENSKKQAEDAVQSAKREAAKLIAEANKTAEALLSDARERAARTEAAAKKNAEKILAAADGHGKEIVRAAKTRADAEESRAAKTVRELSLYASRARTLMHNAEAALDALEATAPQAADAKEQPAERASAPKPESEPKATLNPNTESVEAHDYRFVGGQPLGDRRTSQKRKPYDALNVSYEEPADDGFADVKKIMDSRVKGKKDPTDFTE